MKKGVDLIHGKPTGAMFFFALPMIIGNLFQQFYNMADSVIVGNFVGEDALAAVGASYSFTNIFIMVAIGGGMGTSVLVSQYFGAKKYSAMKTAVYTFLTTFVVFSILLALIGFVVNPIVLKALKTPDNIYEDAVLYLQIYFMGLPFMFMYNILSANFNALGKSKIPLYLLMFSSVLNIVLDIWFVVSFGMGVAGVAIATVIAQGVSATISFTLLMRFLKTYEGENVKRFDVKMLANGVKIAIPSIIQQSIVSIGLLLTQSAVNQFGSSAVAGYSAASRLESICIVPMVATGNAMSTFTAQNLGAGKQERIKEGYRAAVKIIIGFGIGIALATQLFHKPLISAFVDTSSASLAFETGTAYLKFIGCFVFILGFKTITDGILRGSGDVRVYMIANLVNLVIRVSVARLGAPVLGMWIIWSIVPVGWFVNFAISYLWYRTGNWKRKKLIKE
ncbi:MAG: MATE family efflux transporter [Tyzzerella sp.]|nr:MATE family efflux transporter [Tyzzerella sp.]